MYRSWETSDLFFTGSRICAMSVPLKKGKPTRVVFERTYTRPEQFTDIILAPDVEISGKVTYTINVPAELARTITLTPKNLPDGVEMLCQTGKFGEKTYTVTLPEGPAFKAEPLCGSPMACVPRIEVTGYFKDTADLYRYLKAHVADDKPDGAVSRLANQICEGMTTDTQRIDTIAAWVRNNIRYVGIEHGVYAFRPETADAVLEKRYADCKGSANLIRAMLRAVGIDGRLVWIGTKFDTTGSWSERPSLAAGNHMIAAAMLPDSTIFIDGTVAMAPAGMIPSSIAGQKCMIDGEDKPLLGIVPENTPDNTKIILNGNLSVDSDRLNGTYEATFSGEARATVENLMSSLTAAARTSALGKLMSFNRKGVKIESPQMTTAAKNAPTSTISYTESDQSGLRTLASGKVYIIPRPFRAASFTRLDNKTRQFPIEAGNIKTYETHFTINIPAGYEIDTLPERAAINSGWFEGFVEYSKSPDGRTVTCDAILRFVRTHGSPDEASSWNEAVKEVEKYSNTPITIAIIQI